MYNLSDFEGPCFQINCSIVFQTLEDVLTSKDLLPVFRAKTGFVVHQLLGVVDFIHKKGVLHRDIKTDNILFSGVCILKLSDFGLAKHFHGNPGIISK